MSNFYASSDTPIDGERMAATFLAAKDKRAELQRLAGLNGLTVDEVRDILKLHGVDGRQLPRKERKKRRTTPCPSDPLKMKQRSA